MAQSCLPFGDGAFVYGVVRTLTKGVHLAESCHAGTILVIPAKT